MNVVISGVLWVLEDIVQEYRGHCHVRELADVGGALDRLLVTRGEWRGEREGGGKKEEGRKVRPCSRYTYVCS